MNYYNEHDPKAAAWLRELIRAGHIANGTVDERDIRDVRATDLAGFRQCHFFGGLGGWSLALRLAGWADDEAVWTGSCPCQPFSSAGKGLGNADERHLWPDFYRLIGECRPAIVFGEQVASKAALGWLDGVFADLEGTGYACGAADLCAAGIGEERTPVVIESERFLHELADHAESRGHFEIAHRLRDAAGYIGGLIVGPPHIRQRLFWVADATGTRHTRAREGTGTDIHGEDSDARRRFSVGESSGRGDARGLADLHGDGCDQAGRGESATGHDGPERNGGTGAAAERASDQLGRSSGACRMGEPIRQGLERHAGHGDEWREPGRHGAPAHRSTAPAGGTGHWSAYDLLPCLDGKARRVEPGTFPLAHGVSGRVGLLRGYGNAIVPQVAAEFILAYLETGSTSIVSGPSERS